MDAFAARWDDAHDAPAEIRYANARDLADEILAGAPADVFASASSRDPRRLAGRGLAHPYRNFATNRVVAAVPAAGELSTLAALAEPGTRVVIEAAGIPLGDYTRELLRRLDDVRGGGFADAVLANVVAEEQDVDAIAARLRAGDADAAFLYATDVAASGGRLRAIEPPAPAATEAVCVVCALREAADPDGARDWIDLMLGTVGARILRDAGFRPR